MSGSVLQITLSGGSFGGTVVDWPAGTTTMDMTDDSGTWRYRRDGDNDYAMFAGMVSPPGP